MDILVRRFNDEPYVWKKAKFVNGKIMVDGHPCAEPEIVSIRNDARKQYVYCSGCGTYFRKGSKKIEEHKAGCDDTSKCFDCKHLSYRRGDILSHKYTTLADGKYIVTTKQKTSLYCTRSWYDINSQEARDRCVYNRCKNATMETPKCFFLNNPGAFDHIVTVDKILEVGYKNARFDSWNNNTYYTLKGRNTIVATVNKLNIIESFRVSYKNYTYTIYYSKKYNELYVNDNGSTYSKWNPCNMPNDTRTYIKNKIAALYN